MKATDQIEPCLTGDTAPAEAHILPVGIKSQGLNAQIIVWAAPHAHQRQASLLCPGGHVGTISAVRADHSHRTVWQNPLKEPCLGIKITLKIGVIIQMILAQIGKPGSHQSHTLKAFLIQAMGGGLHRGMGNARTNGVRQGLVQGQRIGRGMLQRG